MKLTFLGTRGNTDVQSDRHRRHSALLVEYEGRSVMIDAGEDWRGHLDEIDPDAIILTHAHPDHAWGLKDGAPCPVYATAASWEEIGSYPIDDGHEVALRAPTAVEGIPFEASPVDHSTRAPTVAYRIIAGTVTITYAPDVVYIPDRAEAMRDAQCYVGDGGTIKGALLNQRVLAGLGNIYADEVLYQVGLHPRTKVPDLNDDDLRAMYDAMHTIIDAAFCLYDLGDMTTPHEVTANFVYIRLHGPEDKYTGRYSDAVLADWTNAIRGWMEDRRDVYCFFNNTAGNGHAPHDAQRLRALLQEG